MSTSLIGQFSTRAQGSPGPNISEAPKFQVQPSTSTSTLVGRAPCAQPPPNCQSINQPTNQSVSQPAGSSTELPLPGSSYPPAVITMSLRPGARIATCLLRPRAGTRPSPLLAIARSYSDDAPPAPPLLQKLKADLKTAMRAKDAPRLSVLRAAISATLNASKTPSPIKTDAALVLLLRKQAQGCADARDEFAAAGRADLVDKEAAQIAVLDEYIAGSGVEEVAGSQLEAAVRDAVDELGGTPKLRDVLASLQGPAGPLHGKVVDMAELVRTVNDILKTNNKA
ncbi:Yqey-like protein-domain-containing protein [Nemania sp. NC0429]|nr:Yqey-like protein-domain-containing protein [Nemania sp. NC0429]